MSEGVLLFLAGQALGVALWGVWVEVRVRQHERDITNLQTNTAHALNVMRDDVTYIRNRIDALVDKR